MNAPTSKHGMMRSRMRQLANYAKAARDARTAAVIDPTELLEVLAYADWWCLETGRDEYDDVGLEPPGPVDEGDVSP